MRRRGCANVTAVLRMVLFKQLRVECVATRIHLFLKNKSREFGALFGPPLPGGFFASCALGGWALVRDLFDNRRPLSFGYGGVAVTPGTKPPRLAILRVIRHAKFVAPVALDPQRFRRKMYSGS